MDSSSVSVVGVGMEEGCRMCSTERSEAEAARQQLHEARRSYHTVLEVQRHLAAELEAAQVEHEQRAAALRADLSGVRAELHEEQSTRELLVAQVAALQEEVRVTRAARVERYASPPPSPPPRPSTPPSPVCAPVALAEQQAAEAVAAEALQWRGAVAELEERLQAASTAAEERRSALAAAEERAEDAAGEAAQLRALLAARDAQPEHAVKGNSLFAEVDDKRQEMAQTLLQMKQKNTQLKRDLCSVRAELESLQRERRAVWESVAAESGERERQWDERLEERCSVAAAVAEYQRRDAARASAQAGSAALAAVRAGLEARSERQAHALLAAATGELRQAATVRELRAQIAALTVAAQGGGL